MSAPTRPPIRPGQPQQRPDAGLLQRGGQQHDGVERGADAPGEDVAGVRTCWPRPADRGLAVADAAALHGVGDRGDDLVDPLRAVGVALDRAAAGALLEHAGASLTSAVTAGWFGMTCAASISSASGRV